MPPDGAIDHCRRVSRGAARARERVTSDSAACGAVMRFGAGLAVVVSMMCAAGCSPREPNRLAALEKVRMTLAGQNFELWVADTFDEQNKGLMFITAEEMAPLADGTERGMLFVFSYSTRQTFWMKNTIIPLDLAYIDSNGKVVSIHTMVPLDERRDQYPPGAPYRYAIEVNAGLFERIGLALGDAVDIPQSVLKRTP